MVIFGDYEGKLVGEMTEDELLVYANDAFIFNASNIIKYNSPYAYNDFLKEYEPIAKAIEHRLQLHIEYDYLNEEYYSLLACRQCIEYMKSVIQQYLNDELQYYKKVSTFSEEWNKIVSLSKKEQKEWVRGEYSKAESFITYAKRMFPFRNNDQIQKWDKYHSYYRAIIYLAYTLGGNRYFTWETHDISIIEDLYTLYLNQEVNNVTKITLYSTQEDGVDKGLIDNLLSTNISINKKEIAVPSDEVNNILDDKSCVCATVDFLLFKGGRWSSVAAFVSYLAHMLFSDGDEAKVVLNDGDINDYEDDTYSELSIDGYFQISNRYYQFYAEKQNSPFDNIKYRNIRVYISSMSNTEDGDQLNKALMMIEPWRFDNIFTNRICNYTDIRVGHKSGVANPNKSILLLSVLQSIQQGLLTSNKLRPSQDMSNLFMNNWNKYVHGDTYKPLFADTFYRLKSEPFWMLAFHSGDIDGSKLQSKQITLKDFEQQYAYAVINNIDFEMMKNSPLQSLISDILLRIMECEEAKYQKSFNEVLKDAKVREKHKNNISLATYPIPEGTKEINAEAYNSRLDIEDLVIPEGVKVIGRQAFAECRNIRTIVFPSTLISIEDEAFLRCSSLREISLTDNLKKIGASAFEDCVCLSQISLPISLRTIGAHAFKSCVSLKSVVIPQRVRGTGEGAFEGCKSLVDLTITEGVQQIDRESFMGCKSLTQVTIPASVHWVGGSPFKKTSIIRLKYAEGNTYCYLNPYRGIPSLKEIYIPASCVGISSPFIMSSMKPNEFIIDEHNKTFKYIDGVLYNVANKELVYCRKDKQSVDVVQGTQIIGTYAFANCGILQKINLPDSIIEVNEYAFLNCYELEIINSPSKRIINKIKKLIV